MSTNFVQKTNNFVQKYSKLSFLFKIKAFCLKNNGFIKIGSYVKISCHKLGYEQNLDCDDNFQFGYVVRCVTWTSCWHHDGSQQNGRDDVYRIYRHICGLDGADAGYGRL